VKFKLRETFRIRGIITITGFDKPSKTSPALTRIVDLPLQEFSGCGIQTGILIAVANIEFDPHSHIKNQSFTFRQK
jgi:hypothetical protein